MSQFDFDTNFWNAVVSIIIFELIYFPIAVYYTRRYRLYRNHAVMVARCARLALWEAYIACCKIVYSPLETIAFYMWGGASFITRSINVGGVWLAYFLFFFVVWRIWLLYFQLRWTNTITTNEWKMIIDPNITVSDDWFIKHKATWGNLEWMKWKVILSAFVLGTIHNAIGIWAGYHYAESPTFYQFWIYASLPLLIPCFILLVINCKMQKHGFEDHFFIRYEIRCIFIVFSIQYSGYYAINSYMAFGRHSLYTRTLLSLIAFQCVMLAQFMALMISTCWILRKVRGIIDDSRYSARCTTAIPRTSSTSGLLSAFNRNDNDDIVEIIEIFPNKQRKRGTLFSSLGRHSNVEQTKDTEWSLTQILSHEMALNYFVRHLSRESMSNLRSVAC